MEIADKWSGEQSCRIDFGFVLIEAMFYECSALFNVKERERHPSPSSPPKKKRKKRSKRKRRRNYPTILLPRKREKVRGNDGIPSFPL